MADELTPPAATPPPAAETPPAETPPAGGLPSQQASGNEFDGFALTDDIKAKFKEGKLNGRFSSIDDVLVKLKEAEDFKANTIRDQKQGDQTSLQAQTQAQTINEMLPEFLGNGMVLTAEMELKATEAKIDLRDLKLGALELKIATEKAHSVVGGKENYQAMIEWGKSAMTPEQQTSFDKAVTGSMSEYAIKGLNADYQKAISEGHQPERIQGQPAHRGVMPYKDRKELYKDKDYIESNAGRRDTAAIKAYRDRLRATPDNVMFGR